MRTALISACLLIAGCAVWGQTETIQLRHAVTGETVECGPYPHKGDVDKMLALSRLRTCIEEHEERGYEREPPEQESGGY
jgi:hypothetical protein